MPWLQFLILLLFVFLDGESGRFFKKKKNGGVPIMVQWKHIRLGIMWLWVQSLTLLSGLRIW